MSDDQLSSQWLMRLHSLTAGIHDILSEMKNAKPVAVAVTVNVNIYTGGNMLDLSKLVYETTQNTTLAGSVEALFNRLADALEDATKQSDVDALVEQLRSANAKEAAAVALIENTVFGAALVVHAFAGAGVVGEEFVATLEAQGGRPPYAFSLGDGSLPDGLALSPAGEITGTPTTAEVRDFTAVVTDALGKSASAKGSIEIA